MLVVSQLFESAPHHYEHRTEKLLFIMSKFKVSGKSCSNTVVCNSFEFLP